MTEPTLLVNIPPKIVDFGYLSWTFGSHLKRWMGWETAKFQYSKRQNCTLIFDGGNLERTKYFPDYKIRRREKRETDPEQRQRRENVIKFSNEIVLPDANIQWVKYPGLEADDIVAAYCLMYHNDTKKALEVVGTDKDLVQMGEAIKLIKHDGEWVTIDNFRKSLQKTVQPFVTEPKNILLLLTLLGDKSDSIPRIAELGIPGLKVVARLLQEENPWDKLELFYPIEDVIRNLYLTILPGPWTYKNVLSPDDVFKLVRGGGFDLYWKQNIRKDITRDYIERIHIPAPFNPDKVIAELGYSNDQNVDGGW